jgi:hypothetical protein
MQQPLGLGKGVAARAAVYEPPAVAVAAVSAAVVSVTAVFAAVTVAAEITAAARVPTSESLPDEVKDIGMGNPGVLTVADTVDAAAAAGGTACPPVVMP